ncbi:MAG: sodium-dependent transporter [Lachnospiraceae bacterium]|nr:sodium-dependent transporter [Lachnospiraceae bacterium]
MERENLGSRLGFILLSAGCAIGIGNVWKFPYMVGQYGGGFFVLIYAFFLVVMGVPVMTMEFSLGRASKKSAVKIYHELVPEKKVWRTHGYASVVGCYLLMMFYTVVSGWMLKYFVSTAKGDFKGLDTKGVNRFYDNMLGDWKTLVFFTVMVIVIGVLVCSIGLQNGLERVTKVMMIALLVVMVVLAVNSVTTKGGSDGLKFYIIPDIDKAMDIGIGKVVVAAMNQAFFTLSLGIGSMAIFGSYIDKKRALMGEAVNVAILDTFVAFSSGLIIFPACFAYGVQPDSGPSLIFKTLPNIFNNMSMGRVWGSLFFVFMSFASLSTILAVFENIVACVMDMTGWSRKKSCIVNGISLLVLSLPCALGFNILSAVKPLGEKTNIMDLEDFLVSYILLPLGALVYIVFCTRKYGWGWDKFKEEANTGKGIKISDKMRPYMTYVLPVLVFGLFVYGLYGYFA